MTYLHTAAAAAPIDSDGYLRAMYDEGLSDKGNDLREALARTIGHSDVQEKAVDDYCQHLFEMAEIKRGLPQLELEKLDRVRLQLEPTYSERLRFCIDISHNPNYIDDVIANPDTHRLVFEYLIEAMIKYDYRSLFTNEEKFNYLAQTFERDVSLVEHFNQVVSVYFEEFKYKFLSHIRDTHKISLANAREITIKTTENTTLTGSVELARRMMLLEARFNQSLAAQEDFSAVYEARKDDIDDIYRLIPGEFRRVATHSPSDSFERATSEFCRWKRSVEHAVAGHAQASHIAASSSALRDEVSQEDQPQSKRMRVGAGGLEEAHEVFEVENSAASSQSAAFRRSSASELPIIQNHLDTAVKCMLASIHSENHAGNESSVRGRRRTSLTSAFSATLAQPKISASSAALAAGASAAGRGFPEPKRVVTHAGASQYPQADSVARRTFTPKSSGSSDRRTSPRSKSVGATTGRGPAASGAAAPKRSDSSPVYQPPQRAAAKRASSALHTREERVRSVGQTRVERAKPGGRSDNPIVLG